MRPCRASRQNWLFQQHVVDYLVREQKHGILEQAEITDTGTTGSAIRTRIVEEWAIIHGAEKRAFPAPLKGRQFGGKFVLRVPPSVRQALALRAQAAGQSLKRLLRGAAGLGHVARPATMPRKTMPRTDNANYPRIQLFHSALNAKSRAGFVVVNSTTITHSRPVKTTEDVRKYAAEQGIAEEEAPKKGMEAKSKEFVEKKGAEVYAKA